MNKNKFPRGWDAKRVKRVLTHYERQTNGAAAKEDEAAFKSKRRAVVEIPRELVPVIREVLGQYQARIKA